MDTLGIGQLSKRSGVAIDTVRHYERIGLLQPAARLASGDRRYGDRELGRIRKSLRQLVASCLWHGRAEACPILNALSQDLTQ